MSAKEFKPYVPDSSNMAEFTLKAVLLGCIFGILFGAATVYLALKAGLTVSASIPVAVIAISLGRKFFKTTVLENNIIQTTGSASESIAAGVVFTLPAFLFLTQDSHGETYFNYWTILTLAIFGGILGVLMMIPLRRSLIVKEHDNLPYPEGTACASVLIAGDKGGDFAKTAYMGLGVAFVYAIFQHILHIISETPAWVSAQTNKYFPSATVNGEITPEYLGVGYIIGPRIAGILVAGGVIAWLGLIPLLSALVPPDTIAAQLLKLGYPLSKFGWDAVTHTFADMPDAIYRAYIRQIGAGAVAAGGFMTLIKTLPTIFSSFKESFSSMKEKSEGTVVLRTQRDLSFKTVIFGSLALVIILAILPQIPGDNIIGKLLLGVLIIVFGFFFVTVSSRIVGIIGSSSNPVSGMTIATLMGTALFFIALGWTGSAYEPMALVVGGMICIAASNGGATSQDLKTGYIIGATPKYQQLALFIGVIVSSIVVGITVKFLDTPDSEMIAKGIHHAIGEKFPAPQGTLMATLIKGLLSFNLDWNFVIIGAFLAITIELCGVNALSFAVGAYLPLATTLPIFAGGALKGFVDWRTKKKGEQLEDSELGKGSLFATGLVAGGALMGVIVAICSVKLEDVMKGISMQDSIMSHMTTGAYDLMGVIFFGIMSFILYRVSRSK